MGAVEVCDCAVQCLHHYCSRWHWHPTPVAGACQWSTIPKRIRQLQGCPCRTGGRVPCDFPSSRQLQRQQGGKVLQQLAQRREGFGQQHQILEARPWPPSRSKGYARVIDLRLLSWHFLLGGLAACVFV